MKMKKRLPLQNRHAIKEEVKGMENSGIIRTKAGKALSEALMKIHEDLRVQLGFGEKDLKEAIETGNWKTAVWIAVNNGPEDGIPGRVAEVFVELYKRECKGKNCAEREEQWLEYSREVLEGALNIYVRKGQIKDDFANLFLEAMDLAKEEVYNMEFNMELENAELVR